jgi:predicted MPP superfamily phosphohydrolase
VSSTTSDSTPRQPLAAIRRPRRARRVRFTLTVLTIVLVLFGLPWWQLVGSGADWPSSAVVAGTVLFAAAAMALPILMFLGHGPRQLDLAAKLGDGLLGLIWVLFAWTLLGQLLRLALEITAVPDPTRSRIVAATVVALVVGLVGYGYREARRVPRVKPIDVVLPRLGAGLDGLRVVVLTDTHFGPINRAKWAQKVVAKVNEIGPDVVCHTGDLADGTVARRHQQVVPLGEVRASSGKYYITGNHEYFGAAQDWLDYMRDLGWDPLHNLSTVVERGGDRLVVAGIDDPTGAGRLPGHGPDLAAALDGIDPGLPVLLLAHQPKQVGQAVAAGIDLQLSGHTHGGQIWPFHYLVRTDQPVVAGLSRHGTRTQLYTSRGTGFWGPPLRIFAPSEITVLTLRSAASTVTG